MTEVNVTHTAVAILGVVADIILALALMSIVVGLVWVAFPLKDIIYSMGTEYVYTPLGGRTTGLMILSFGFVGLILGLLLDRSHAGLTRKFGART